MIATAIEMSNGFRVWAAAAFLFALPAIHAFLRVAWKRAIASATAHSEGMKWGPRRAWAFALGALQAGRETNLRVNAWVPVTLLVFGGIAGGAIFVSSSFFGSYATDGLSLIMLPMWAMLAAGAWGAAIETAHDKMGFTVAAAVLFVTTQYIALTLDGGA